MLAAAGNTWRKMQLIQMTATTPLSHQGICHHQFDLTQCGQNHSRLKRPFLKFTLGHFALKEGHEM